MAVSHQGVFVQTPKITPITIVNGTSTNKVTVATAGSDGSKVSGIIVTSDDSANRVVLLWLTRSATSYLLGAFPVTALAGSDGVQPGVNLLNTALMPGLPIDNDGQVYLFLESGDTLQVSVAVAVTAGKTIYATAVMGNF